MTQPLALLPDDWAARAHCPICGHAPLQIERQLEADRLNCARCGTAFEVEDGGPRLRLVRLPALVQTPPDGVWRSPAEARTWVREQAARPRPAARPAAPPPPEAPPATTPAPANTAETPAAVGAPSALAPLNAGAPAPEPADEPIPAPAVNREAQKPVSAPAEALARGRQLLALRHSLPHIQALLERYGDWSPAQIQAVMAELARAEAQARARQMRQVGWAVGALTSLCVIGGLAVALLSSPSRPTASAAVPAGSSAPVLGGVGGPAAGQPAAAATTGPASLADTLFRWLMPQAASAGVAAPGTPAAGETPAPAALVDALLKSLAESAVGGGASSSAASGTAPAADLPAPLQTLLPPGVQVTNPTPVIHRGATGADGAAAAAAPACPASPAAAAELFGGQAAFWRYDSASGGWILFSAAELISVRIPSGMTAGYLTFGENLGLADVTGPATIDGINMLAVTCN